MLSKKTIFALAIFAWLGLGVRSYITNIQLQAPHLDRSTIRKAYWRTTRRNWTGNQTQPVTNLEDVRQAVIAEAERITFGS